MDVIKSIYESDQEILKNISILYNQSRQFHLDPCYSVGSFYDGIAKPLLKFDKLPQTTGVVENDILNGLPMPDSSVESIVFDPPFMFETRKRENLNIMKKRFSMFHGGFKELEEMYKKALLEFNRILIKGGIVAFKCQDFTEKQH